MSSNAAEMAGCLLKQESITNEIGALLKSVIPWTFPVWNIAVHPHGSSLENHVEATTGTDCSGMTSDG